MFKANRFRIFLAFPAILLTAADAGWYLLGKTQPPILFTFLVFALDTIAVVGILYDYFVSIKDK